MDHADGAHAPDHAPVAVGMLPLACGHETLLRAQRRLAALAGDCSARIDQLQQAFERWPQAAHFEPFEAVPVEAAAGRPVARGSDGKRRHRAAEALLAEKQPTTTPRTASARLSGHAAEPVAAPAVAQAAAGPTRRASLAGDHRDATLSRLLDGIGDLAELGGRQVTQLMQRHAASPVLPWLDRTAAAGLASVLSRRPAADSPGQVTAGSGRVRRRNAPDAAFGTATGSVMAEAGQAAAWPQPIAVQPIAAQAIAAQPLAAQSLAAQPVAAQPAMRQLAELLEVTWASVDAAGRPAALPPQLSDTRTATQLLEGLLTQGLSDLATEPGGRSGKAVVASRQPAPRAVSRLLAGPLPKQATGAAGNLAPGDPASPGSLPLDQDEAGDALAQQISRLLLDQAWMRGVDLK